MKKMFQRFTALLLALCLMGVPAMASDAEENNEILTTEENNELVLTLDDAIKIAKENNPQLNASDAAIKSAELNREVTEENQREFDSMAKHFTVAVNVSNGMDVAYLKHGYYLKAANVGLELEKMEKNKVEASISYDVTEKYFNVKLMEELVKIGEKSVEIAKSNADIINKNYELGFVSLMEVKNAEAAVKKAQASAESYRRNQKLATDSFKIALQMENSDKTLKLTDEITIPSLPENWEEKIEEATNSRYDVTALKKAYELSEEYFNITKKYVNDRTAKYHSAYSDYINSKYTYENTLKLIKLGLRSEYMNILTCSDAIVNAENDLEIKTIDYESAKIKYEMGVITNLELTAKMAELDSVRVQLENARLTYLLAVLKFNYNIVIGI